MRSTYANPTANAAIANIAREERERRRRQAKSTQTGRRIPEKQDVRKQAARQNAPRYSEWAQLCGA